MVASRYDAPVGELAGVDSLRLGLGSVVGLAGGAVGVRDGLGVTVGVLVAVGRVVLGAGAGSSWVQATGPTIHAATNRAVMTGRRMLLLGLAVPPPASGVAWAAERPGLG
jgi:hypothetical protein